MKKAHKILKLTKVITLVTLLLIVFATSRTFDKLYKKDAIVLSKTNSKKDSSKQVIQQLPFEATISVFAIEFSNLSQFVFTKIAIVIFKNEHIETKNSVSITPYFRILFSKILPINAP